MDEELSAVLTEVAERALSGVDAVTEFGAEHLPDVVIQLLWWHAVRSALSCLAGIAIAYAAYRVLDNVRRFLKERHWINHPEIVIPASAAGLVAGIAVLELIDLTWIQILVAPKLYILEYAARLAS